MSGFRLEMILVVVRPLEEGGNEVLQVRAYKFCGHGVNGEFDRAENGLDDLAVGGSEEYEQSGEDFGLHGGRNSVCGEVEI